MAFMSLIEEIYNSSLKQVNERIENESDLATGSVIKVNNNKDNSSKKGCC